MTENKTPILPASVERIDLGYAVVYIDHEGETLKDESLGFFLPAMTHEYYSVVKANLQWNYYLIIPREELVKAAWAFENHDHPTEVEFRKLLNKILMNDSYAKKYVLNRDNIRKFVNNHFPPFVPGKHGEIVLYKGIHHADTQSKARRIHKSKFSNYKMIPSFHRNLNSLSSLYELDYLRKELLKTPDMKVFFNTHLRAEFNWARHKFSFLNPEMYLDHVRIEKEQEAPGLQVPISSSEGQLGNVTEKGQIEEKTTT